MNAPFLHRRTFFLAAFIAGWGFGSWALAQQPAAAPPPPAEARSQRPRVKPQVIYHLPPASNYAAALHSQAKTQRDTVPVDNSMPTSLRTSRAAANEAAAKEPPEVGAGPRPQTNSTPIAPAHVMKPRSHSPGPSLRHKPASKGHGHGNKSHRK